MDLMGMVPDRVPNMGSDRSVAPTGADPQSHPGSSPLSFYDYLTDHQLGTVAVFASVHEGCDEIELSPTWSHDLSRVLELVVSCPCCGDTRTCTDERG